MILDAGKNEVIDLTMDGGGGTAFSHIAVGSGSTSTTSTDTNLENETGREAANTHNNDSKAAANESLFETTFDFTSEISNTTIREFGVVNSSTGGTFLTRTVLAEDLLMQDGDKLNLVITVEYVASTATHQITSALSASSATTTDGAEFFAARTIGSTTNRVITCTLGSDGTTPTTSDTALGSEITTNDLDRASATSTSTTRPSTGTMRVTTRWTSASDTSDQFIIREVGIFTSTTNNSGIMLARYVYAIDIEFRSTNTYEPQYEVELV